MRSLTTIKLILKNLKLIYYITTEIFIMIFVFESFKNIKPNIKGDHMPSLAKFCSQPCQCRNELILKHNLRLSNFKILSRTTKSHLSIVNYIQMFSVFCVPDQDFLVSLFR